MFDLAIIGGGPAGVAAGVYAARKRLKTLLIAETIGGQSTDSQDVQNWIGTPHISGLEMAKQLERHLREYAGDVLELKIGERAATVEKKGDTFLITTNKSSYEVKTVLVATGGARKKLEAAGAAEFEHKGVTYCASCDGPLFSGQDVAVVGGGNAGFETAAQLLAYCKSVTLIHRQSDFLRADKATVDAVLAHSNMKTVVNSTPVRVMGDQFVKSISVKNNATGAVTELPVAAVFVEIGMLPATDPVKGLVDLDEWGKIKVDAKNQRAYAYSQTPKNASDARRGESESGDVGNPTVTDSSGPRNEAGGVFFGVWAAGDCSDGLYHQNNIAAGDAVKALEDIYFYIKTAK